MNIADVISGQARLAGLQWALLAPSMRKALRRELAALLPDARILRACRLRRAKYKPGRHLTAYFDVGANDAAGMGRGVRPIEVVWALAGSEKLRGSASEMKMQEDARAHGLCAPFRGLLAEAPELGMRVRISPLDARFPQLVRVSTPQYVRGMLDEVYARGDGASTQSPAVGYAVTPVRYRPGQRHVLRYDPLDGPNQPGRAERTGGTVFAKLYQGEEGQRAFRIATLVAGWLAASGTRLTAVRPLGYVPSDGVILYPRVMGVPLSEHIRRRRGDVSAHLADIGPALRALQSSEMDQAANLEPHNFAAEVKAIARACEHIQALLPEAGAAIDSILARAKELHERLPQEALTFAHGDLKADHIWVTPAGLTLIDFDTCYLADPAIDVGKFLADLHWWYAGHGLPGVEQAQEAFLTGYTPGVPPERLARARLYEALVLVKITARRVRLFERDWAERTEQLIRQADEMLSQVAMTRSSP